MSGLVVKIGTSSLTNDDGVIDVAVIEQVCAQVAALRSSGVDVSIVTSGAIAAGMPVMGLGARERPTDTVTLQALSAIGQPELITEWSRALAKHDLSMAQILLAPHNFGDRQQYLHARTTLEKLHQLGVIPLINENDAVTDDEIRFGDNDRIAALVATLVDADLLLLLTDTDGVLTADPRVDPNATLIEAIVAFDKGLEDRVGGAGSARGSGGMASKLTAAKIASWSGVRTVIANASRPNVLADAVAGESSVGTVVLARERSVSARKLWIGFAMRSVAVIGVDEGARAPLSTKGASLLSVGVSRIEGVFERGDAVEVASPNGEVFAKGLARISSSELESLMGEQAETTGSRFGVVVVHADDLVIVA